MSNQYSSAATLAKLFAEHDNTVLVVDAAELIVHVESASPTCIGLSVGDWTGRTLASLFDATTHQLIQTLIAQTTPDAPQSATIHADRSYALRVIAHGPDVLLTLRPLSTLAAHPAKLRAITEALPDAIYRGDGGGLRLVGYHLPDWHSPAFPLEKILHQRAETYLPSEMLSYFEAYVGLAHSTGEVQVVDYLSTLGGAARERRMELRFVPLPNQEILLLLREVTPRFETLQRLYGAEGWARDVAESVPDMIVMYLPDGEVLYMNPAGRAMLGFPHGLGPHTNFHAFVASPYLEILQRNEVALLADKPRIDPTEVILTDHDGSHIVLELRLTVSTLDTETRMLVAVGRDIGPRKQVEHALAMANLRYELLLNNTPEGLVVATLTGQIVDVNPAFCQMLGATVNEVIGRNMVHFLPSTPSRWFHHNTSDEPPIVMSNTFETVLQRGDRADVAVVINIFFIDAGDEPFLYFIVRDVTSERLLQTWLQNSANHWQVLYEIDNAILAATSYERLVQIVIDTLGKLIPADYSTMLLIDSSTHMMQLYLLPNGRHTTMSMRQMPLIETPIFETWRSGRLTNVKDLETSHHRLPQALLELLMSIGIGNYLAVPILTDEGLVGVLGLASIQNDAFSADHLALVRNVAASLAVGYQQLALKEQLRQYAANLEQKVHERTQELARLNDRLRELDQLKSMFVSDVSHELRTPVNNIGMRLHLLENDTPAQQGYHLERLKTQIHYLAALVEDILQLSRMDLGRSSITLRPVNLEAIIEGVVEANLPRAGLKNLNLLYTPPQEPCEVLGERNQLSQVVNNLVVNAINYTHAGTIHVYVRHAVDTAGLELVIEDTGMGIPEVDKPRIFERFYRGRQVAKSNIAGTGLGLAIVQEIIQIHGGRIWAEDNVPHGTRFIVWLPQFDRFPSLPDAT